jgi:DNA modification methylase
VEWALDDGDVRIALGDAAERLREMASGSVQMVCSSPPFWGLRDYGTGTWEGGDPEHEHDRVGARGGRGGSGSPGKNTVGATPATVPVPECSCGALYVDPQIGMEETPDEWAARLVGVYRECRRVLRDDGVMFVEVGDSYSGTPHWGGNNGLGHPPTDAQAGGQRGARRSNVADAIKPKDMIGQPWLLAFALRADGWFLRSEIIWAKANPMPESVTDRVTRAHSTVFMLSKRPRYFWDADAIREAYIMDGRKVTTVTGTDASAQHRDGERWPNPMGANARSVWTLATEPTPFAHFATWPQALVERMVKASTSEYGCCVACGAPWRRVVEREGESTGERLARKTKRDAAAPIAPRSDGGLTQHAAGSLLAVPREARMVGWEPTCQCGVGPETIPATRPCVVLDPFMGSGTTALVARRLGRHAVGVELNPDYLGIAARRLQQLSLLA